jgi:hypothetical protein
VCELCDEGYFFGADEECTACPDIGTNCYANGTSVAFNLENLPISPGYWRISPNTAVVRACTDPKHCKGGQNFSGTGDSYCAPGHTRALCTKCDFGDVLEEQFYFDTNLNTCVQCEKVELTPMYMLSTTPGMLLAAIVGLLVLLKIAAAVKNCLSRCRVESAMSELSDKGLVPKKATSLEGLIEYLLQTSMAMRKKFKRNEVRIKALTSFFQSKFYFSFF